MKLIKITSGTYGLRTKGAAFVEPKTPASEPFVVSDEEAKRLANLGVASIISDDALCLYDDGTTVEKTVSKTQSENAVNNNIAPSYSVDSKVQDLRTIAKEAGITFPVGTSKTDMVKQLDKHFADRSSC